MDTRLSAGRPAHHPAAARRASPGEGLGERVGDITALASVTAALLRLPITAAVHAEGCVAQAGSPEAASSVHVPASGQALPRPTADLGPTGLPGRSPLSAEGAVAVVAAVAVGSWIALGGVAALGYVLVRSAHTRIRDRKAEWAAVEPGWRKSA